VEFTCDEVHYVEGATIMTGIVREGILRLGQILQFGPDDNGHFRRLSIESIHVHRIDVGVARAGQSASVVLSGALRSEIRRGVVLLDVNRVANAVLEFSAEIVSTNSIPPFFECVVHVGSVSQLCSASFSSSLVRFRFRQRPEYVRIGSRVLFREGFGFVVD
jgi:GTPase